MEKKESQKGERAIKPVITLPSKNVLKIGFLKVQNLITNTKKQRLKIQSRGSIQFSHSVMSDSLQPHESQHACPSPSPWSSYLSITISQSSLKLMSIKSVMPSSHLIFCHPLLLLPPIPPSIRVFSNESTLRMWWPKYWSLSFSIIPSKEHPG